MTVTTHGHTLGAITIVTLLVAGCSAASPSLTATPQAAVAATLKAPPSSSSVSPAPATSDASTASIQPSSAAIPDGDYETERITSPMLTAALEAAGLGDKAASIIDATGFHDYVVFVLRLREGKYVQFQAVDGGPAEAGSLGTVVSMTDDALVLQETQSGSPFGPPQPYAIRWDGATLHIDLTSFPNPDDYAILTAIYESSPWTRKP